MFLDALTYPLRRGGWVVLLLGAVFSAVLDLLSRAPIVGIAVAVFSAGYFGAFYLSIVGSTMTGRDEVPEWPAFNSFLDDILAPFFRLILLVLVSFAPAMVVIYFGNQTEDHGLAFAIGAIAALIFGLFYFPLAVLATSAYGGLTAVSPHIVLPAMIRCLPGYLLDMVELIGMFLLIAVAGDLLTKIPYIGGMLATVLGLYGFVYQARLIGMIYRVRYEKLGWD